MPSLRRFIRVWASGHSTIVEIRIGEAFMDAFDRGVVRIIDREGLKSVVDVGSEPVDFHDVMLDLGVDL